MLLVVDLDDTLYDVQSIGLEAYKPALKDVERYLQGYSPSDQEDFYFQFKHFAFSHVAKNFNLPERLITSYYDGLKNIEFDFSIQVFDDYAYLKQIGCRMILLTTGIPNIQMAKLAALGIQDDFDEILIDDPSVKPRVTKWEHLLKLIDRYNEQLWVIGDNPEAELQAGKSLGLPTIQRLKADVPGSAVSDYCIRSFEELHDIFSK